MAIPQTQRKPVFFWQGVLILLPVAVLAVVSVISLQQDERAAEQDARNRAAENVQSLARAMRASVNEELQRFLTLQNMRMMELNIASQPSVMNMEFPDVSQAVDIEKWERDYPGFKLTELATPQARILCDGRQMEPADLPAIPVPPKWFRELSPRQKERWESLRAARAPAQIETCRENFLHSQPSADAQQAAFYLSQPPEQSGGALLPSEAGISFDAIGCYRLLSATNARLTLPLFRSIWWEVINRPSLVSPKLLELAAALTNRAGADVRQKFIWTEQLWHAQTQVREWMVPLHGISQSTNHWNPPVFWAHWTGGSPGEALAFFKPTTFTNMGSDAEGVPFSGRGYEIWFVPRKVVDAIFDRALNENSFLIPGYASAEVTVEGHHFESAWNHGLMQDKVFAVTNPPIGSVSLDEALAQNHWQLLGTAAQTFGSRMMPDGSSFELKFYLTDRGQMLSAARRRAIPARPQRFFRPANARDVEPAEFDGYGHDAI